MSLSWRRQGDPVSALSPSLTHKFFSAPNSAEPDPPSPSQSCAGLSVCSWAKESRRELSLARMRMFLGTISRIEHAFWYRKVFALLLVCMLIWKWKWKGKKSIVMLWLLFAACKNLMS